MNSATGEKLGMIMRRLKMIDKDTLLKALKYQKLNGGPIGGILIKMKSITQAQLNQALAIQSGMEFVNLDEIVPEDGLIEKVSAQMVNTYHIFPVRMQGDTMQVAMVNPDNYEAIDNLKFMLDCSVEPVLCDEQAFERAVEKYYKGSEDSVEDLLGGLDAEKDAASDADYMAEDHSSAFEIGDGSNLVDSAPVIKLLNYYLLNAIHGKASDIHFEPFDDSYKVRMRIDGALVEMQAPPRNLAGALSARIKVMAGMDIAETRLPQDNRIELMLSGNPVDLRVSTLPTKFGESVVLRVLDRRVVSLDIEQIGMSETLLVEFRRLCQLPNGIILVTGPTGSGKTTTLYSALSDVNDVADKIITTEDPVEYDLEGIMQVQVSSDIGLTFASCLRSILRQDPDKILVGEIRDLETARIAVDASLTGHLVFSTLHTNSAALTVARLIDMGIEPFSVAATLEAVLAQRLVRTICRDCKEEYTPTQEILFKLGLKESDVGGRKFFAGRGCNECHKTGYRGRTAMYELLKVNDRVKELILSRASAVELNDAAVEGGMVTLKQFGVGLIFDGRTTIEEVLQASG
ncbi:MAG: GspE/PulE family protein [Planctomycetota bacterium]